MQTVEKLTRRYAWARVRPHGRNGKPASDEAVNAIVASLRKTIGQGDT